MSDKIPSAEDLLQDSFTISYFYDDKTDQIVVPAKQVQQAMIEFAKLHVKAALEASSKNVKANKEETKAPHINSEGNFSHFHYNEIIVIDKESILNSYPEDLIK